MLKNNKGITIIALVITIIILLILASVATVSGIESVNNTKFNNAKAQFQTMQAQANSWYEESKNNAGVLNYGEDLSICDTTIKEQTLNGKDPAGYRYFKADYITDTLDIDGISYDFLINISNGTVLLYGGITYQGRTYYSAEDFGINSVNHTEVSGAITFDTEIKDSNIIVYNIKFPEDVLISKYDVQYKDNKKGDTYWTTLTSDKKKPYTYTNAEGNSITDNNAWYIPLEVQNQDGDNILYEGPDVPYIEGNEIEVEIADVTIKIITKSSDIASNEKDIKETGSMFSESYVGKTVDKTTILRDAEEKKVVVPAGFTILEDSRLNGDKAYVKNGIVVQAPDGSEFVWVPVPDPSEMYGTDSSGNILGKLWRYNTTQNAFVRFDWSETGGIMKWDDKESNREPSNLPYIDKYTSIDSLKEIVGIEGNSNDEILIKWDLQLKTEFKDMIESVKKYNGFYIGRYETSFDENSRVQSKKGGIIGTGEENSNNTWYGFYQKEKKYNKKEYEEGKTLENVVGSSMMWGSQYDQMIKWMYTNGIDVMAKNPTNLEGVVTVAGNWDTIWSANGAEVTRKYETGSATEDKLNNIYELTGVSFEWTLEATSNIVRVMRRESEFE